MLFFPLYGHKIYISLSIRTGTAEDNEITVDNNATTDSSTSCNQKDKSNKSTLLSFAQAHLSGAHISSDMPIYLLTSEHVCKLWSNSIENGKTGFEILR